MRFSLNIRVCSMNQMTPPVKFSAHFPPTQPPSANSTHPRTQYTTNATPPGQSHCPTIAVVEGSGYRVVSLAPLQQNPLVRVKTTLCRSSLSATRTYTWLCCFTNPQFRHHLHPSASYQLSVDRNCGILTKQTPALRSAIVAAELHGKSWRAF